MAIDRVSPSRRPELSNSGTQTWKDLLFVHWPVDASALRPLLPEELTLDDFEGRCYVGLVPFLMRDIRAAWMPRATALSFLETNLRTYVRYRDRPGVWFFSLEASSWLAVQVARSVWKLPYFHASMRAEREGDEVHYASVRKDGSRAGLETRFRIGAELPASEPGTLQHFLLERYLLFSKRGARLYEGQVHHRPYPPRAAEILSLDESLIEAAGLPASSGLPPLAHFSAGVDVEVFGPWPADRS